MRNGLCLSLALLAVVAAGCQSRTEPASGAAPAANAAAAPASNASPATAGVIGVAACDEYLTKWENCIATKVSADAREQVKVALDATREGWKRAALTAEGKAGLEAACKSAADLAAMQVSAYGCSW